MSRASCIYRGWVRHRRHAPVEHSFRYSVFLMYLDLAELDTVFDGRWLWSARRRAPARFLRSDHFGDPAVSLDVAVRDLVESRTSRRPDGPIRLLTHLRYFGYCFNPVSLYFCFEPEGRRVQTVVAEVSNTPWGERHCYVLADNLAPPGGGRLRFRSGKRLHVSPFLAMDYEYDWSLTEPGRALTVHIDNVRGAQRVFDATMTLSREEIGGTALARVLLRYPLMTVRVMLAIHYQALRLWLKRVPLHTHPDKLPDRSG